MANDSPLQPWLQAKQELSRRYLQRDRPGLMLRSRSVGVAVAAAAEGLNVHAVGVGKRLIDGAPVDELAVKVYVTQKLPASLLGDNAIPRQIDGMPTDVVESPPAFLLPTLTATAATGSAELDAAAASPCTSQRQRRLRPVPGGVSTGHLAVTAGTIACFCRSIRPGDDPEAICVLSNNHIYADVNKALPGDPLLQQARVDGGTVGDAIALLERFVPIKLGGVLRNRVDAAIGRLLPGVPFDPAICSIGAVAGNAPPVEGMRVRKHGRTTGLTEGRISDLTYDVLVGMDHMDPTIVALFEDQIRIEQVAPHPAFGLGGDSGSLVVTSDGNRAVGLYFAGPEGGAYGIANPIDEVLAKLQIELI